MPRFGGAEQPPIAGPPGGRCRAAYQLGCRAHLSRQVTRRSPISAVAWSGATSAGVALGNDRAPAEGHPAGIPRSRRSDEPQGHFPKIFGPESPGCALCRSDTSLGMCYTVLVRCTPPAREGTSPFHSGRAARMPCNQLGYRVDRPDGVARRRAHLHASNAARGTVHRRICGGA